MQKKITELLKKGILLSPDILTYTGENLEIPLSLKKAMPVVIDAFFLENLSQDFSDEEWRVYEKNKAILEFSGEKKIEVSPKEDKRGIEKTNTRVEIIESYECINKKIEVRDFISMYNSRFNSLQSLLRQRQELSNSTSIRKILSMGEGERVSCIAMVMEASITKNNNLMLTLEDQTGIIKAVVSKNSREVGSKEIIPDEVIGVTGTKGSNIIYIDSVIIPDVPLTKELKKSPVEEAAVFISDIHIGSKAFLRKHFERFIEWINGRLGREEQKALVRKVKYLFILGDLVEGIGVYPEQEKDLEIKDLYGQYKQFTDYIHKIPKHISVIICPGNHDSVRIAEPQPSIPKEFLSGLSEKDNLFQVSSPSIVRIGKQESFPGFDVLIYHGFSFPYYADAIESIRLGGGLNNTSTIMSFLLGKRHLAPTHGSTQYQLGYDKDPLTILNVPDFFVSGHIHKIAVKNYRNVTMMNCSCWVSQTPYQEKRGITPEPAKAVFVDLMSREVKVLNFE